MISVLDDVDHLDQLEALACEPNWFKRGSRIIITTRDEQVLVAHRVHLIHDIDLLSDKEATCLFSIYAFGRENPGTIEKLELSYMSLEDDYKEIFLDIACILKGRTKEDAIKILESCGFYARNGLKVLEQRSLITIIYSKPVCTLVLGMHDHIEEMGKNIVRREHPDEPNKHSHLWIAKEIEDILSNDKVSSVACPNLKVLYLKKSRLRSLDLELIPNLESLDLKYCDELVEINAPDGCLKKVGYLNLNGCSRLPHFVFRGRSGPKVSRSSASLHLIGESLDLCPLHPNSNLPKLRFGGYYEEDLPSSVGNIEKLISFGLCACTDLKKFSDIICSLECLQKLTLKCNIPEFPKDLGHLCALLEKLPEDIGRLGCLKELDMTGTRISHLPKSIFGLKGLKIAAPQALLQLYDFPSEMTTTTKPLWCLDRVWMMQEF
nr:Toll/interleukin-1 receptor (TIR) domain-containing protein [Tanacetum cinerariifolium]